MNRIKNPTLILGLGGSGFLTVSKIKQLYLDYYQGNMPTGLRFLCIDFDNSENNKGSYKKMFGLESTIQAEGHAAAEWIKVSDRVPPDQYILSVENPAPRADIRFFPKEPDKTIQYVKSIGGFDLSAGAGQKRMLGKIGISYSTNYERIYAKVKEVLSPLFTADIEGIDERDKVTINIIGSCSGGAGSGMLLDIIFMLSKLINYGINSEIITFNYLPDILLSGDFGNIDPEMVKSNAYGTICELEYIYEKIKVFIPTHFDEPIGVISRLPRANFLINDRSFGGTKINYRSMINSTAGVISNLNFSANGLDSQWSNFQNLLNSDVFEKPQNFCSLGYTEILFRPEYLEAFILSGIYAKAIEDYTNHDEKILESKEPVQELRLLANNLEMNFLRGENEKGGFRFQLNKLMFPGISTEVRDLFNIQASIELAKNDFELRIRTLVKSKFDSSPIKNCINAQINKIRYSSDVSEQLNQRVLLFKKELLQLKIAKNTIAEYNDIEKSFEAEYKNRMVEMREVRSEYKTFFGNKKEKFWVNYLPNLLVQMTMLLESHFKEMVVKSELVAIWNSHIDHAVNTISIDIENDQVQKLPLLKSALEMPEINFSKGNTIFLESYISVNAALCIANDPDINAMLIEKYLSSEALLQKGKTSNRNEDLTDRFRNFVRNTESYRFFEDISKMNIFQIKKELSPLQVKDITGRLLHIKNPLWDRENDDWLAEGKLQKNGVIIKFTRIEIPVIEKGISADYFGKDSFLVREGDIYYTENPHRQTIIELELGLPAVMIKNRQAYEKTFLEALQNSYGTAASLKFFTYDEIRQCVLKRLGKN